MTPEERKHSAEIMEPFWASLKAVHAQQIIEMPIKDAELVRVAFEQACAQLASDNGASVEETIAYYRECAKNLINSRREHPRS